MILVVYLFLLGWSVLAESMLVAVTAVAISMLTMWRVWVVDELLRTLEPFDRRLPPRSQMIGSLRYWTLWTRRHWLAWLDRH